MKMDLFFVVNASCDENFLYIKYSVTNQSTNLCYLVNVLTSIDMVEDIDVPDPNKVFFGLYDNNKVLICKKRPEKKDYSLSLPIPYYVTPLKPKETFNEIVRLKVPLEIEMKGMNKLLVNANFINQFVFQLGYIMHSEVITTRIVNIEGTKVSKLIPSGKEIAPEDFKPVEELFLTSEVKNVRIPIKTTLKL